MLSIPSIPSLPSQVRRQPQTLLHIGNRYTKSELSTPQLRQKEECPKIGGREKDE